MSEFHITGAQVLVGDTWARDAIGVRAGGIVSDLPGRAIHLPGWQVMPGIVDLHGDGFERHLAPRRGALNDLRAGLLATEAELAANGITTATLAQFYSWEGGMRGPAFAAQMLAKLDETRPLIGTDMRAQLRVETHLIDDFPAIEALINQHYIRFVVFNDHLPHAALAAGKRPPRLTGQALKSGRSPEAHLAFLQELHDRGPDVPAAMASLTGALGQTNILMGSHDDATAADRQAARAMGLTLCEFPETQAAATEATAQNEPTVLGAPNVVRGGSHKKNASALSLIELGLCTALASDYHYPAPYQAALKLADSIGLPRAWALISTAPSQVLGLMDRGTLAPGKRADITAINPATGRPGLTIAQGRITYMDHTAAAALLA